MRMLLHIDIVSYGDGYSNARILCTQIELNKCKIRTLIVINVCTKTNSICSTNAQCSYNFFCISDHCNLNAAYKNDII